ncbi:heme biosynthesis HemY N-terminal domain-containing protein [Pseudoteredinibacter isoporae]|uniref:HemY protein n=1 Tax=Pseudoteredinibacter isoporae TaxID=570281 RepID=A0A7X0JPN3_9GAMM|nr:heme biosynthesis HemY N-terminal domain-containing protein [Pseudoteredinibacter isoporae]MBB6519922.1 HemY protein [Pseudoteredinibacter isoporae]NHO85498.1 heme biosynthesis protein HemY [Pseudoteredinibacter isoporae]NIB26050.1 heme biosynthesis protein HemY [Pseudoteredinibacter isoporae]
MRIRWKRKLLIIFAIIGTVVGLDYLVQHDSGYVLIAYGDYSVEMSFWAAFILSFVVIFLVWLVIRLTRGSVNLVKKSTGFILFGSAAAAQKRTEKGLVEFIEGDFKAARKDLLKSAHNVQAPVLNYLAAARSAHELGDETQANELLLKAEEVASEDSLAIIITQARIQFSAKNYEKCVATLEKARKISPRNVLVLEYLRNVYTELEDWESLERLLPELNRNKVGSEEERLALSDTLYLALIDLAGEQASRMQTKNAIARLQEVWEDLPKDVKKRPAMVAAYVQQLRRYDGDAIAENLLRRHLQKDWQDELITLYGLVAGEDLDRQLIQAENWLKQRPADSALLLSLARLSLRNELWGKAKEYYQSSIKQKPGPEACAELGRLLAAMGEHELSTQYYQQGLKSAANVQSKLPLPKPA